MMSSFDEKARDWDQNDRRRGLSLAVGEAMLASLQFTGEETLLDYGVGTGLIALRLAPKVKRVIGMDTSKGMLAVLGEKAASLGLTQVTALEGDLTIESEALGSLHADVVVSSMTMHHVPDTEALFRAWARLLPPEGQLAVADLEPEDGSFHHDNTGVMHFGFAQDALLTICEKTGFYGAKVHRVHTMHKVDVQGQPREYGVFLLTARRARST